MGYLSLLNQTVTIESVSTTDNYGKPTYGTAVTVAARVEHKRRRLMTSDGLVIDTEAVIFLPAGTTIDYDARITLPNGKQPKIQEIRNIQGKFSEHHIEVVV